MLTEKEGIKKARLVARGFEEDVLKPEEKQSPTCTKESLRILLPLCAANNWVLKSLDIKAVFLQGEPASREIYLLPPREAKTSKVWRLNKCVYGLSDTSLKWYEKVKYTLLKLGCVLSPVDRSLFVYHLDGNLVGILAVHVDDFIWTGSAEFEKNSSSETL